MNNSSKTYLVTGCAGFIANRVVQMLLDAGHRVVGVDNMNDYYDVSLKQYRLNSTDRSNRLYLVRSGSSSLKLISKMQTRPE